MIDASETPFLRDLLAQPEAPDLRQRYAEWLDDRGEPKRAEFLRLDPRISRLDCVRWLEAASRGNLSHYYKSSPELRPIVEAYHASDRGRKRGQTLAKGIDPAWVSFVESMGCPFGFFDNTTVPVACQPSDLPFSEPIGTRVPIVTFASDFREPDAYSEGLAHDLEFLATLGLEDCSYGSASCPVHPFICRLSTRAAKPSKAKILASLRTNNFDGFAEGDSFRDQIHQDFLEQNIFPHPDEEVFEIVGEDMDDDEDEDDELNLDVDETTGVHGTLREYVDGKLWYVLLHTRPVAYERGGPAFPSYVILFAIGRSPHGDRLVGVVTHQLCHNLCD